MRRIKKLWFVLLLPALLGAPSSAQAQYRTFGGGYFGSRGGYGFGYGNYGYIGGFGNIYGPNWGPSFGSPGNTYGPNWAPALTGYNNIGYGPNWAAGPAGYNNIGYGPNWGPGAGAMAGNPYGPGLAPPFYSAGTILSPGFGPTEALRMRASLYPAIPEPSRGIIAAALETDVKDKARIEIRVPTAQAKVYLDGVLTKQTGLDRTYLTPTLNPNSRYSFNVDVVWQDDTGTKRNLRREISFRAGETKVLNLRDD